MFWSLTLISIYCIYAEVSLLAVHGLCCMYILGGDQYLFCAGDWRLGMRSVHSGSWNTGWCWLWCGRRASTYGGRTCKEHGETAQVDHGFIDGLHFGLLWIQLLPCGSQGLTSIWFGALLSFPSLKRNILCQILCNELVGNKFVIVFCTCICLVCLWPKSVCLCMLFSINWKNSKQMQHVPFRNRQNIVLIFWKCT